MTYSTRFKQLAQKRGLTVAQLAEVFGVDYQTMYAWYFGISNPRAEFRMTLERFEREDKPALSPRVSADTAQAFHALQ